MTPGLVLFALSYYVPVLWVRYCYRLTITKARCSNLPLSSYLSGEVLSLAYNVQGQMQSACCLHFTSIGCWIFCASNSLSCSLIPSFQPKQRLFSCRLYLPLGRAHFLYPLIHTFLPDSSSSRSHEVGVMEFHKTPDDHHFVSLLAHTYVWKFPHMWES